MLLWGVVVGSGTGMVAIVLGATVANRWFIRNRGLVLGILTASSATGQLIFLPVLASLAEHQGWRAVSIHGRHRRLRPGPARRDAGARSDPPT